MMQQRVKNIAYLSEVIVDLASVPVTGQDVKCYQDTQV